ncbi:hypothetical protein QJQ45_006474 [Haematococcus lacustris]|nr:hypothetical protein QJQ45_006474 [Haematococcus lacustris]
MASQDPKPPPDESDEEPALPNISAQAFTPIIKDDTPFPVPEIYFKVYESEEDEPEAKIRRDVGKLYDRWLEKYGRRWPENGMNTEDLVWVAEEAYKPKIDSEDATEFGEPLSDLDFTSELVPIEKEAFPGEFIPEPGADGAAAGPDDTTPGSRPRRPPNNYEATVNGCTWVTDEFESIDYEAGNLETLWGTYLWDREGKPIFMPDGPPNEAQGEESEEWDDFYGSYRPRHIDTEEAREAVWATDEYESDEDNTESEWEPEFVGAGMGLQAEDPFNPQYSLRHSNHPLAPFPGEGLKWSSFVYDDGTTYEGLTRDAVPHGMGVMIFGNGTGGGFHFRDVRRGDKCVAALVAGLMSVLRFEGEFQVGYAHGLGQMTSERRGEVYIGEFYAGQRHGSTSSKQPTWGSCNGSAGSAEAGGAATAAGELAAAAALAQADQQMLEVLEVLEVNIWCGIRINMQPYYYLLQRGEDPVTAYQRTHLDIMKGMEFRTWYRNKALGDDYEDEVIYHAVLDDLGDPYMALVKGFNHEGKLRQWSQMSDYDKAILKTVEIIEQVGNERAARTDYMGVPRGLRQHWTRDETGRLQPVLDSDGNNTDFDTVDMMVGRRHDVESVVGEETDGSPGLGWIDNTLDEDRYPMPDALQEQINLDVLEDKMEESEDKEQILGQDLLNPFTGLTLRDYLDGREGQYQEMLDRTGARNMMRNGLGFTPKPASTRSGSWLQEAANGEDSSWVEPVEDDEELIQSVLDSMAPRDVQEELSLRMDASARLYAENPDAPKPITRGRNPYSENTDTRFETESDMMEMCELAEILGTVDEAKEVVTKARMWRWKPEGEVTLRYAQDANGAPLPLMQDPLHYPHGTKFMAPGPLGQCHPLPDDQAIRNEMLVAAKNHEHIYSMYNFDYDPEPGSIQWHIDQRIARAGELQQRAVMRMAAGALEVLQEEEAEVQEQQEEEGSSDSATPGATRPQVLASLAQAGQHPSSRKEGASAVAATARGSSEAAVALGSSGRRAPHLDQLGTSLGRWPGNAGAGAAPLASMGFGMVTRMSQASKVMLHALTSVAKAMPVSRPRLVRPSHLRPLARQQPAVQQLGYAMARQAQRQST